MIYRNMEQLKLSAGWKVVKVGDTTSDVKEGVNAGVWTVGVIIGSSEMGYSLEAYNHLSETDQAQKIPTKKLRRFFITITTCIHSEQNSVFQYIFQTDMRL
ncbi:Phosphonoacetaldehyde hydrolase [compost metagenome]